MSQANIRVGYRPTPGLIWPTLENSQQLAGFEYELLTEMAQRLNLSLFFQAIDKEAELVERICAPANSPDKIDIAIGALQGSSGLEQKLDILFPHLRNRTVVLVKKSIRYWVKAALREFFTAWISRALLAGGFLFCYVPALLTTLVEMRIPDSSFDPAANPLLTAAWYAVVTISTVGYGDLSPVTPIGRLLAAPMIAFAPLLYVGLVQQLWTTFRNAFFRAEYLNRADLKAGGNYTVGAVKATEAYQALRCDVGCCDATGINRYEDLLDCARQANHFDVLVVEASVAAYILHAYPMQWSLGQEISEGLGYSCLVPEGSPYEEAMRQLIFSFHENGTLAMLKAKYFEALS
ncbi:MAG: ion channel [Cyanobacteria bacterium J06623_4]